MRVDNKYQVAASYQAPRRASSVSQELLNNKEFSEYLAEKTSQTDEERKEWMKGKKIGLLGTPGVDVFLIPKEIYNEFKSIEEQEMWTKEELTSGRPTPPDPARISSPAQDKKIRLLWAEYRAILKEFGIDPNDSESLNKLYEDNMKEAVDAAFEKRVDQIKGRESLS